MNKLNELKALLEIENEQPEQEQKPVDKQEIGPVIIEFFTGKDSIDDDTVHTLADDLGIDKHEFEEEIYKLLMGLVNLKGSDKPDDEFDAEELKMGIEIEKEHTDYPIIAKRIAKGHLVEFPNYYSALKQMESELKAGK